MTALTAVSGRRRRTDRVARGALMLLTGAKDIADVLSFPAAEEYPHARHT